MIVIDASVVTTALVGIGRHAAAARARLAEQEWLSAPHLLDLEVLSALRRAVLREQLSHERAREARSDLRQLRVERYPSLPFHERIWELRANVTSYDASYVALAEALGCTLLTGDRRLACAPGPRCEIEVLTA